MSSLSEQLLVVYKTLSESCNKNIIVFIDYDDTLFYKKGYSQLISEGKYEEAKQIPITPMPHTKVFLKQLKMDSVKCIIVTKRAEPTAINQTLQFYFLKKSIAHILHQREEGEKTLTKGKIICEYLATLQISDLPKGILFIDDMEENLKHVKEEMDHTYSEIETKTFLIPAEM